MDTLNKATLDGSNPIDLRHAALYPTAWTALPLRDLASCLVDGLRL